MTDPSLPSDKYLQVMSGAGDYRKAAAALALELEKRSRRLAKDRHSPESAALNAARRLERRLRPYNQKRRRPPESGLSVPAMPPKGPLPKQGGAAAPLDFGAD